MSNLFENLQLLKHKNEGVKISNSDFVFDYTKDDNADLIHLTTSVLYKSTFDENVYYFGYVFSNEANSKQRSDFINFIKGYGDNKIKPVELKRFIDRPLAELNKVINLVNIDVIIYPISKTNELTKSIMNSITNFMPHDKNYGTYSMVKNASKNIEFDYNTFISDNKLKTSNEDYENSQSYRDSIKYIELMMKKINSLDYFHIAKNVKPKYRKYIKNYLIPTSDFSKALLNANNILLVDDINTSGSTLREIIRYIREINNNVNIYVFTLIGKE